MDHTEAAAKVPGPFAGIVSSFAALNTVDLDAFSRVAGRLLPRGGRLVCHMLSPGYFTPAQAAPFAQATTVHIGGERLPHINLPADEVYRRFFAASFLVRGVYGLGLIVRGPIQRWIPARVLPLLGFVDRLLGSVPFLVSRGRFFVLDLERR